MKEQPSHFGVLSYGGVGHLNSLLALSRRLVDRGHRVTFFQKAELEARVREYGLEFSAIGATWSPVERRHARSGIADLRYRIERITDEMVLFFRDAPGAIRRSGIDALIIDEIALAGPTLAQMLKLPYVVVSTSVPHNFGWTVPQSSSQCDNPISLFGRLQNVLLQASVFRMRGPVRWKLDQYRRQRGLGPIRELQKEFPALAHIATLPECVDFPRSTRPINFYYTGPFVDESARPLVDFPWGRLNGRPLIYVSLGTARKIQPSIFRMIAEGCEGLDLQVVMSLGGRRDPRLFVDLPGDPLVVREAPQLELIKIAAIVINHAGINTVLETLLEGKPMIAIPITHDQPALAARLSWLHVAEVIPERRLSANALRSSLLRVLNDSSYGDAARQIQDKIQAGRGLERAVEVIETRLNRRSPVVSVTPRQQG
ncbi:MAG: glycosyltransferase [Acidobacteriaceae bacterium]|jgi:zeaxanthin glucosyltransferase